MTDPDELRALSERLRFNADFQRGYGSDTFLMRRDDADGILDALSAYEADNVRLRELNRYTSHDIGCALYQRSWASSIPPCTCGLDALRATLSASPAPAKAAMPGREEIARAIFETSSNRFMRVGQCYPAADKILTLFQQTPPLQSSAVKE